MSIARRFSVLVLLLLLPLLLPSAVVFADSTEPVNYQLKWDDRRPIGRVFLARSEWRTPKNPGGHLGPDVDTTTPQGMAQFRERLLKFADQCIVNLKAMNAQGVVVWDLEGWEFPGMVFVGDPRKLPLFSPAMDQVADEFFRRFADAGLRPGLCLRPNYIFTIPPASQAKWGKWGYILYREPGIKQDNDNPDWLKILDEAAKDPSDELADRVNYARKRWNATLFYVDTNSYTINDKGKGRDVIMTAAQFGRLAAKFPDTLFMPEHQTLEYYAYTAPYEQIDVDGLTPPEVRKRWRDAFNVNSIGYELARPVIRWDELVQNVMEGDALYCEAWLDAQSEPNRLVAMIYHEAELRRSPEFASAVNAGVAGFSSDKPVVRLAALSAIKPPVDDATVSRVIEIALNLKEGDAVIRRAAIAALGRVGGAKATDALRRVLVNEADPLNNHAIAGLYRLGEAALPALQEVMNDQRDENRFARQRALQVIGRIDHSHALPLLCLGLADKYSANRAPALRFVQMLLDRLVAKADALPAYRPALPQVYTSLLAMRALPVNTHLLPQINDALRKLQKLGVASAADLSKDIFSTWGLWVASGATPASMPADIAQLKLPVLEEWAKREHQLLSVTAPQLKSLDMPALLSTAQDLDPAQRYQAVLEMARRNDHRFVEPLIAVLPRETDPVVQRRMIEALAQFASSQATPALKTLAESGQPGIRPFAAAAVERMPK